MGIYVDELTDCGSIPSEIREVAREGRDEALHQAIDEYCTSKGYPKNRRDRMHARAVLGYQAYGTKWLSMSSIEIGKELDEEWDDVHVYSAMLMWKKNHPSSTV